MIDTKEIENDIDLALLRREIHQRLKNINVHRHAKQIKDQHSTQPYSQSVSDTQLRLKHQGKVETISIPSSIKKNIINLQ